MIFALLACQPEPTPPASPTPTPRDPETDVFGISRSPPDTVHITELGELTTGTDGLTIPVTIDVAAESVSFYPMAVSDEDVFLAVAYAEAPDGTVWVDLDGPGEPHGSGPFASLFASPNPAAAAWKRHATLFPNTPDLPSIAGTWTVRFGAFDADRTPTEATMTVGVLENRRPVRNLHTMLVALHFTGSDGLDVAAAADDADVQNAVQQLRRIYGEQGIEVFVQFYDLELDELVELPPGCGGGVDRGDLTSRLESPDGAINVVFVEDFECDGEVIDGIGGYSIGIPQIPLARNNGVFVGTGLKEEFPGPWAITAAHEVGHVLGLFHTDPDDPLADTEPWGVNFMDPSEGLQPASNDQGWVIRRSPWLR